MAERKSYVCDFTGEAFAEGTVGAGHAELRINVPKEDGSGIVVRKYRLDLSPTAVRENLPERLEEIRGGRPPASGDTTAAVIPAATNGDTADAEKAKATAK